VESRVAIASPRVHDGADIHRLVADCGPLDLNSTYAYLLLCRHFRATCVRAEHEGRTVGFVSAYRPPEVGEVIFVWQVAVSAEMRGQGLARRMLRELLSRPAVASCRYLETTVAPSNKPSLKLFHRLACDLGAPVAQQAMFEEADFGDERHERETLIRIGPFDPNQRQGKAPNESQNLRSS